MRAAPCWRASSFLPRRSLVRAKISSRVPSRPAVSPRRHPDSAPSGPSDYKRIGILIGAAGRLSSRALRSPAPAPVAAMASRPENIGIVALELYVPSCFVPQKDLEVHDGVSAGKYTLGLGQENLGFCGDNEDVISMSLTVVQRLLERNGIDPKDVGRLEVGTETIVDKSKSIKTVLMTLFESFGNTDIEGADNTNACYGGTAALLNCLNWVDSSGWDGRYAIAVAADVAVYAAGPARPTGGAGAVAMLVGPNASLALEHGLVATHASHAYDFYKPKPACEYPVVDGKLSQVCYLKALDECYKGYGKKFAKKHGKPFSLQHADRVVLHSPYNKLVQKGNARLVFNDLKELKTVEYLDEASAAPVEPFLSMEYEASLVDKDLEKAAMKAASSVYQSKVVPGTVVGRQVGNMYAASLYAALASAVGHTESSLKEGDRLLLFSYGSGLIASMFSFVARKPDLSESEDAPPLLRLEDCIDLKATLETNRKAMPATKFVENMELMESRYGASDYFPTTTNEHLQDGVFYLERVDDLYRRHYKRKESQNAHKHTNGSAAHV